MGVAGTLALGVNSASDGPVHTEAMSDEAVPGEASAAAEDLSESYGDQADLIPTALATQSAGERELVGHSEDRVSRSADTARENVERKVSTSTSTANRGHAQTLQPTEVTPPASSTPSSPAESSAPEPSTTPSGGDEDGRQGGSGGGLVGGVVTGVGGLVGGLLGG